MIRTLLLFFVLISCNTNRSDNSIPEEKKLASNELEMQFVNCDCSARFPTYTFKAKDGTLYTTDLEQVENSNSFICDRSFGSLPIINPFENKKFILTFDSDASNELKNVIALKLNDNVNEKYSFKSIGGGQYDLVCKGLSQTLIYTFRDYTDTIKINFVKNSSVQQNEYGSSLFVIENKDLEQNTDVNLWSYNPESGDYDLFVLSPRIEIKNTGSGIENESDTHASNSCNICGRNFRGHGYQEVSDGVWKPCEEPYQCFICSPSCGMKHTHKMNSYLDAEPVNSSRVMGGSCGLCRGTGIERGYNPLTDEIQGRVCPMCDGQGFLSY